MHEFRGKSYFRKTWHNSVTGRNAAGLWESTSQCKGAVFLGVLSALLSAWPTLPELNPSILVYAQRQAGVGMKGLGFWLVLLVPGLVHAQQAGDTSEQYSRQHSAPYSAPYSARQEFVSGGTVRLHLEAGGYTIIPGDSGNIVVDCRAPSEEQLKRVRVEIKRTGTSAEVYVSETPNNNFQATIEVPRRSNLWVRLSAGELIVEDVEGDKDVRVFAGRIQIDVPHPELYGHRDASVTTGSIEASAFDVTKEGLFRSFEQHGPGKYRLHAHLISGEIELRGSKSTKG